MIGPLLADTRILHWSLNGDRRHDPFDRLIIAQAKHEGWPLMTADPAFRRYDVAIA
ncbi:PIN domain-containing protein [Prosthecodimorpha staleyi]|uniref:PIN domain-containing protein n=1 Tax=Prosthecodimorpha staleyi TaxID=2840188 RepID=A0A947GFD4_9HYPH|nr:PIN domain-containing protein [Prosthecodimorpha staleyi]MBT9293072.1 PIN domain-containing protein [Prosthecodimorpha staleyi]